MRVMLTEECRMDVVKESTAAGTTTLKSASVDMHEDGGWDDVLFIVSFETPAANNILSAECSSDDAVADAFAAIEDSAVDVDTDDPGQRLDIREPPERYVRASCARGTSTVLGTIWAIRSRGRKPFNPTADYNVNRLIAPEEGTA